MNSNKPWLKTMRYFHEGSIVVLITFLVFVTVSCNSKTETPKSFDVIIDTDLGGDPDDIQSLFRAVHYSDILKIKGIISTPCTDLKSHPWDTIPHVELISTWIKRIDVDHLRQKGYQNLMDEETLLDLVKLGSVKTGSPTPDKSSEGSQWIIKTAQKYSQENPLWILVWGSMTSTAQALYDAPEIADKIRIYSVGSTNTLHDPASRDYVFDFMQDNYPELWWIENGILPKGTHETFRGVYQSGLQKGEWAFTSFIDHNIKNHGSTHNGMFEERCGDAFPVANWPENSLKEGDSPSMLYLLSSVLGDVGDVNDPTAESWGGQFRHYGKDEFPNYYVDLDLPPAECQWTIGKWRYDFMKDWKQRWDRYNR
ncbi:nucleoside hydrolase-like domain-containing protein [Jiulongibacter sp. NS-SX5]|uniref:nucleoside hydrolase-like domain-containing protein n=1 Tax=Jiulongibacter sp. NS-SX5 TaxID=3463854 RepID=UPI0040583463